MDTMKDEQYRFSEKHLKAIRWRHKSTNSVPPTCRECNRGWPCDTDDVLTVLADARLEIARLTEERDDARSRLRLEQSSVRNCDRFLVDTTRKCDQQREDIRRLLWLVEAYIRVYPNNSGNAIRVVAELKERYDA